MSRTTVVIGGRTPQQRDVATRMERRKGISANRAAYDKRRRRTKHDAATKTYMGILGCDPCAFCGFIEPGRVADRDHIVPLNKGGLDVWENFTAACRSCNRGRRDTDLLTYLLRRLDVRTG